MTSLVPTKPQQKAISPFLNQWSMYYHLPYDKTWNIQSYHCVMDNINHMTQCIALTEMIPENILTNCMFFVMRRGIEPMWEHPSNRNGGAFSFKVNEQYAYMVWRHLMYVLCGETLLKGSARQYFPLVNGITISPKRSFCIIKIWMRDCSLQDPAIIVDIPNLSKEGCLFKRHEAEF
jgi:hypothetical protein